MQVTAPLDALFTKLAERSQRNDESFVDVDNPKRARRLMIRDALLFVIVLAAWVVPWAGAFESIASVVIGGWIGLVAFGGVRRASAYRSGWLSGRSQMISALVEAQHRNMTPAEWLEREMARDFGVMGVDPPAPRHRAEDDEL